MQKLINSTNIILFAYKATFDVYARTITFDASATTYNTGGAVAVPGICFTVEDSAGLKLLQEDFTAPHVVPASGTFTYVLNLPGHYAFIFQTYKISAQIKEANGTIYTLDMPLKDICAPEGFVPDGYVEGLFTVDVNCTSNKIIVKEATNLSYKGTDPVGLVKAGNLYFPLGTISPVVIVHTPFEVNGLYTGTHKIVNITTATYDLNDGMFVVLKYYTQAEFNVSCGSQLSEVLCCIEEEHQAATKHCGNAVGARAKSNIEAIQLPLMSAIIKEMRGIDASQEVEFIRKRLNCDCGCGRVRYVEATPQGNGNYTIVLQGGWATTVDAPLISGNTKTYTVRSPHYVVAKLDNTDQSFTISLDQSVTGTKKYLIGLNYNSLASSVLNAISQDSALQTFLNSLINQSTGFSIAGLDGKCVLNTDVSDYALIQTIQDNTETIEKVTINGVAYVPSSQLLMTDVTGILAFLNGLGKGAYTVTNALQTDGTYKLTVMTTANTFKPQSMTFKIGDAAPFTVSFQGTSYTLVAVLQAIVNYICALQLSQIKIGGVLSTCRLDSTGALIQTDYGPSTSVYDYLNMLSSTVCTLHSIVKNAVQVSCTTMKNLFPSRPSITIQAGDYLLGTKDGNCSAISYEELTSKIISIIKTNAGIRTDFCSIDCGGPNNGGRMAFVGVVSYINPDESEMWYYHATWQTVGAVAGPILAEYSTDLGATWTTISGVRDGDTSYRYHLTNGGTVTHLLRMTANGVPITFYFSKDYSPLFTATAISANSFSINTGFTAGVTWDLSLDGGLSWVQFGLTDTVYVVDGLDAETTYQVVRRMHSLNGQIQILPPVPVTTL